MTQRERIPEPTWGIVEAVTNSRAIVFYADTDDARDCFSGWGRLHLAANYVGPHVLIVDAGVDFQQVVTTLERHLQDYGAADQPMPGLSS